MARKRKTMDGNTAAAHVAYMLLQKSRQFIPLPHPLLMAELSDKWSAEGRKICLASRSKCRSCSRRGGAAGTLLHGSLTAGALTTTFTASQGLLLMIPNV